MLCSVWKRCNSSDAPVREKNTLYIFLEFDFTILLLTFKNVTFPAWPELLHFDFWFLSHFSRFALLVIPDSCSGDKHSCGLFLSPVLERMSFLQRQCASLHRSLNQWRILIISYSIMQLTIIYVYEICLTFTTIALLLAQWLLNSLISSPPHFRSPWLHLSVYGCSLHHCSWASHRLGVQAFAFLFAWHCQLAHI